MGQTTNTGRFSTGMEQGTEPAIAWRVGRYSDGLASTTNERPGRFSDGMESLIEDPTRARVGSFADGCWIDAPVALNPERDEALVRSGPRHRER
jgi:hypothetical protein